MVDLVRVDGDTALFFLNDGSVVEVRNLGDHLEVGRTKGSVSLRLVDGTLLTFSERTDDEQASAPPYDPFKLFHVKPPVKVVDVGYYRDGGTVSFAILDARGNKLVGGYSRQLEVTPRRFYVGAEHPGKGNVDYLEVGGSRETALVAILQSWLDQELDADDQGFLAHAPYQGEGKRDDYRLLLQVIEETRPRRLGFRRESE